jgi:hypothetical protein
MPGCARCCAAPAASRPGAGGIRHHARSGDAHAVTYRGEPVELAAKEYAVLHWR